MGRPCPSFVIGGFGRLPCPSQDKPPRPEEPYRHRKPPVQIQKAQSLIFQTLLSAGLFLAASVLVAMGLLLLVRRRWTAKELKQSNDVAGVYHAGIVVIYAVIQAFLLTDVWNDFNQAGITAVREANSLVSIFRLADAFPESVGMPLQEQAREYARAMVEEEWPAMARQQASPGGNRVNDRLWRTVLQIEPQTSAEQAVFGRLLGELTDLVEHRRMRHLQARTRLPAVLWTVLWAGGVITVGFTCLFGVENPRLHLLKTAILTSLVCLVLIAIAELDGPFEGAVRVPSSSFELAVSTFDRLSPIGGR